MLTILCSEPDSSVFGIIAALPLCQECGATALEALKDKLPNSSTHAGGEWQQPAPIGAPS